MKSRISFIVIFSPILIFLFLNCAKQETQLDMMQIYKTFRTAYNNHDTVALNKLLTDDVISISLNSPEARKGKELMIEAWKGIWTAFPDFKADDSIILTSDEYFGVEETLVGTFTNPWNSWMGIIQPTGGKVEVTQAVFFKVTSEGLISEIRHYGDSLNLMKQLGVEQ